MKRIFKELTPFYMGCIIIFVATVAQVGADLFLPNYMSSIVNLGIINGDVNYIINIGIRMLVITILGGICAIIGNYFSSKVSAGVGRNLRKKLFTKVSSFSLAEFDQFGTSSLITRTTNDIIQIQTFLNMFLRIIVMSPIMAVGGIYMSYLKSSRLSFIILIIMPILITFIYVISRFALPLSVSLQEKIDRVNLVMREKLTGIRVIRAFGTESYEEKRFDFSNVDLTKTTIKMQRVMGLLMPLLMLILNFTTIWIVYSGSSLVAGNEILVGDIMAIVQYLMQIMMSLMMLSFVFVILPRATASSNRINDVLQTEREIVDGVETTGVEDGTLEFKNVTFFFPNSIDPAIKNVTFKMKKGQTTAIIGSTGSGKSALVSLIPRFYDVSDGEILLDGINIKRYTLNALRDKIGFVPQKTQIFSGTPRTNIAYSDLSMSDERVISASKTAFAYDFISAKEGGFDSPVSQNGQNLSGGQKQRISIARAIAKNPDVYIFDDSFSALDYNTDMELRTALKEKIANSMMLIVAQRISTIMEANQIIVLDKGEVSGIGTHDELLNTCDVYKEIVSSQFSKKGGK